MGDGGSDITAANVLFAVRGRIDGRWAVDGITANALMPGGKSGPACSATSVTRSAGPDAPPPGTGRAAPSWKTPEQGAATSVLLATSPLLDGIGGRYFEDCNEAAPHEPGTRRGVAPYALDASDAALLWQVSVDTLASSPEGRGPSARLTYDHLVHVVVLLQHPEVQHQVGQPLEQDRVLLGRELRRVRDRRRFLRRARVPHHALPHGAGVEWPRWPGP